MQENSLEQKLGFDRIRNAVRDRCQSSLAASIAEQEQFSSDEFEIRHRLLLTDEMRLILLFEDNFPASGFIDTVEFLLPLEQPGSSTDLLNLRKLRTMLDTLSHLVNFFESVQTGVYPNLKKLSSSISAFPLVSRKIDCILDRYGNVRDDASDELAVIRKSLADKQAAVSKRGASILRKAHEDGIVEEGVELSMRDGRLLIPVPAMYKRRLPGFVYNESASGKTAFVEPAELVELGNEIRELQFAEQREIVRILYNFCEFLRPYVSELLKAARYMAVIDFIVAKARLSLDMIAGMPVFSEDGSINLRKARHPLLEKSLRKEGRPIVPVSLSLDQRKRILLVSGPNAGGKSVCLKTMGLLQYMFQWGMLIPTSETSEMMVFDRIMVDIGDDQNLDNDLSTYSSFLANMREMLEHATERSLVLIDEFGSGTEPAAGGAIAEAILAALEKKGVYGVITTHYSNLKMYASRPESSVINGAMAFDAARIQPLFKLEMGLPGNSFAFEMARKNGLPEEIVKDAENRAGDDFVDMERSLRKIARSRKALDEKLERVSKADRTLEDITDKYQKELSDIKQLRKKILEDARDEAKAIIDGANRQVENTIRSIKESQAEKQQTAEARKGLQDFLGGLSEAKRQHDEYLERKLQQLESRKERNAERRARRGDQQQKKQLLEQEKESAREAEFRNAPLHPGEKVRIKDDGGGMVGEVVKINGKNLVVQVGNMTVRTSSVKVERITSNEFRSAVRTEAKPVYSSVVLDAAIQERKLNFRPEIDLRGERLSDALETVMHYIDDAVMLGVPQVRIIHGKGTGVLHEEIQKYLRSIPAISSVEDEHIQFGGSGVTIVRF